MSEKRKNSENSENSREEKRANKGLRRVFDRRVLYLDGVYVVDAAPGGSAARFRARFFAFGRFRRFRDRGRIGAEELVDRALARSFAPLGGRFGVSADFDRALL